MSEVRIRTEFGEVVIPYNEVSDLEKGLANIDKVIEIVNSKVGHLKGKEKPKVKFGFEDIYTINDDGSISILRPGTKTENIGIVLYAYDPKPLKTDLITLFSGVKQSQDYMRNSKYFDKLERGYYKLNAAGLSWIINEVVPKLKKLNNGS
ncbi:hypothetical protein [Nitrosotalea sinensis]|uniref:hypothetical protein n=1 Tax=Nitrosotalea sinensis TaxID=1499975 RepID=UPI001055C5A3|nr:hypothetical protein [Candidatus Nitrosotalea sinensis]